MQRSELSILSTISFLIHRKKKKNITNLLIFYNNSKKILSPHAGIGMSIPLRVNVPECVCGPANMLFNVMTEWKIK